MQDTPSPWFHSRSYDLRTIFGGALFGVALPLLALAGPSVLLPTFLWVWLIFFEGSHFFATTSRSLLDPDFRRENAGALPWSLWFYALPLAALGLARASGSSMPKELYGLFIFLWSLYHVLRQHYGFICIYQARSKLDAQAEGARFLYARLWIATVISGAALAVQWRLPGQFGTAARLVSTTSMPLVSALVAVAVVGVLAHTLLSAKRNVAPIAKGYFTVVVLFNLWVHVGVPLVGPKYPGASNFPQSVLLFIVLNSIFHNTQYHAIVWRYRKQRAPSLLGYWAPAIVFGLVFAGLNFVGGELPLPNGVVGTGALGDLAFVLLTGIIGQHFYLDSRIWKLRKSPSLHKSLALEPTEARAV